MNNKRLASKNYDLVTVMIRNQDEPLTLGTLPGLRLMEYLTSNNVAPFVHITDIEGNELVVKTTDISRVEPRLKTKGVEDYV